MRGKSEKTSETYYREHNMYDKPFGIFNFVVRTVYNKDYSDSVLKLIF